MTRRGFYEPITQEVRAGNVDTALQMLEKAREKKKFAEKDRFIYFVDAGMLNYYAGRPETSNLKLALADQAADELFTKSISRAALSVVLNDNVLEYSGEDYEILYSDLISALNYISMENFDGGFVEIRQANQKLDLLEQKYADAAATLQKGNPKDSNRVEIDYKPDKVRFYNDAFARYLSMHMYAAAGRYDDARIDYGLLYLAFLTQPHIYDFDPPVVKYRPEEDNRAILSVVGLAGLAPLRQGLSLRLRSDKDLNLVQILYDGPDSNDIEYTHLPIPVSEDYYFKFAIPVMKPRPSAVGYIRVLADGRVLGELQLIEDVNRVAEETFAAKKSLIFLRSIARAIAKGLATHKMKKDADSGGLEGWLKKAAIDVTADISENADLRSTEFLPGRVYIGDFELEPGPHDLAVEYYDIDGRLMQRTDYDGYVVLQNGLNLIQSYSVH